MPDYIEELINLALIYYKDGAPATAAARLRTAADEMQHIADQHERALREMVGGR